MNEFLKLRDCNGQWVFVDPSEILAVITSPNFLLFGMSLNTILEFREQYLAQNGPVPITSESIIKVFGTKKGE